MSAAYLTSLLLMVAGPRPSVVVSVDPCLELDDEILQETVRHTLGAGVDHRGDAAAGPEDTSITLDCGVDGKVEITLVDPHTHTSATQIVELPEPERRAEQLGWAVVASVRSASAYIWRVRARWTRGSDRCSINDRARSKRTKASGEPASAARRPRRR